jgi:uncharacterized membrane protein HdeD (DUF308 family)
MSTQLGQPPRPDAATLGTAFPALGIVQHWGRMLFNGVVTLALGVMIWRQWPLSGLYLVGLFLGINLVISGASYISLGLRARRLPV